MHAARSVTIARIVAGPHVLDLVDQQMTEQPQIVSDVAVRVRSPVVRITSLES